MNRTRRWLAAALIAGSLGLAVVAAAAPAQASSLYRTLVSTPSTVFNTGSSTVAATFKFS